MIHRKGTAASTCEKNEVGSGDWEAVDGDEYVASVPGIKSSGFKTTKG